MEIKYLKALKNIYETNSSFEHKGMSENEISLLELKMQIKLPLAYKEFLFLAGKQDGILNGWDRDINFVEWRQENLHESMSEVNLHLEPIFVFAAYDTDQCLFFFLNEGDNPPVYIYAADKFHKNEKDEYVYYKKTKNSFSECIENFTQEALSK